MSGARAAVAAPSLHGALVPTAAVALGASVVGAGLNFALAVVVGRAYGAADTGLFFAVIGVFLVVANLLKFGGDTGLVRFAARLRALGRQADLPVVAAAALIPVLVAGTAAAVALWLFGGAIGGLIDGRHADTAAAVLRLVAPFAPLLALTTVLTAGIRGLGRVTPFALVQNVALPATRLLGVVVATWLGLGIAGAAAGWAAGLPVVAGVAGVLFAVTLRRVTRAPAYGATGAPSAYGAAVMPTTYDEPRADPAGTDQPRRSGAGRRELWWGFWRFSLPRAAATLVEIALEWLDVLLVAVLAGEAAAGVYAVSTRLVKVSLIVDNALRVTVSTRISAWLATRQIGRVQRLYEVATQAMIALIWPALVVLAVYADVALAVFGREFTGAAAVLRVMCVGVAALTAAGSLQSILLLGGGSLRQLGNKSVALATCVGANVVLTPSLGALGGALAWVSTVLVDTALVAWAVHRHTGVRVTARAAVAMGPLVLACVGPVALALRWLAGPTVPSLVAAAVLGLAVLALALHAGQRLEVITHGLRDAT